MDYTRHKIQACSPATKKFDGEYFVNSTLVVGALVEASMRLAYRPAIGTLQVPLVAQSPQTFTKVDLKNVIPPGASKAVKSFPVKAFRDDVDKALRILREGMGKLQEEPYRLEVAAVDHTGGSSCPTSHDTLMNTRVGGKSCLPVGSYSIEWRVRCVGSKTSFAWEDTLTRECMPLWQAELQTASRKRALLQARILMFACIMKGTGSISLHASINYSKLTTGWQQLFGWSGFKVVKTAENASPALAVAPVNSAPVARQPGVAAPVEAPAVQWRKLQCKLVVLEGDWIKINSFCSALRPKILSNQAKRDYIVGSTAWRIGSGQGSKLVHKTHWDNKACRRGGAPPLIVKRSALEQVFYKYYAKK